MLSPSDAQLVDREPDLPGMSILLDTKRFMDLLRERIVSPLVESVRCKYVRYKPQTNCLCSYEVRIGDEWFEAHAIAYNRNDVSKIAKAQSRTGTVSIFGDDILVFPGPAIVFYPFPNDPRLQSLGKIADPTTRRDLLARILPQDVALWEADIETLAYKPGRRYVAALTVEGRPQAVIKFYGRSAFNQVRRNAKVLSSRNVLRIADRLGQSERHGALALRWMSGELLSEQLRDPSFIPDDLENVGAALAELHERKGRRQQLRTFDTEMRSVNSAEGAIAALRPDLTQRARHISNQIAERLKDVTGETRLIHGDFYAKQVLIQGDAVAFLDVDEASRGNIHSDPSNFIAHLLQHASCGNFEFEAIPCIQQALIRGYRSCGGKLDTDSLDSFVAMCLFCRTVHPFRDRDPDWMERVEVIIRMIEELLGRRGSGNGLVDRFGTSSNVVDPFQVLDDAAMSFIEGAIDPEQIERQLSSLEKIGGDCGIELHAIRVVRHKPGRRCLIEYDLSEWEDENRLSTAVGKVRVKGLDKRTFRLQNTLWEEGFGPEAADGIRVPEPLGAVPDYNMWLQRKVEGISATNLLRTPDGIKAARRMADAIAKLHEAAIPTDRRHRIEDELRILHERLNAIGRATPAWRMRLQRLLEMCDALAAAIPTREAMVGIHRDFYSDHLIIDRDVVYLIDFDLFSMGDPALDVGNAMAHIAEYSLRVCGDVNALSQVESALCNQYLQRAAAVSRSAIEIYRILSLVRHIQISQRIRDRRPFTNSIIDICEKELAVQTWS